jgi:hypothetical protein
MLRLIKEHFIELIRFLSAIAGGSHMVLRITLFAGRIAAEAS